MRTLLTSLAEHPMAMLRGIAELNDVTLTTNAHDDAAAQLATALAEPGATDAALAACSEAGRAAWAALRAAGGRMKTPIFTRGHGALRPVGPARLEREAVWLQPENGAEELWYRGLIFRGFADLGDGPAEYIYIPFDLLPAADSAPAEASPTALSPATEPERRLRAFNSLAVDLCALLAAIREAPARVDAAGRVRPADLSRLREGLLIPDPIRIELMLALARGRGWLAVDRDRLALNSQAATGWLRATPWEQMTALFEAWRESTDGRQRLRLERPAPHPRIAGRRHLAQRSAGRTPRHPRHAAPIEAGKLAQRRRPDRLDQGVKPRFPAARRQLYRLVPERSGNGALSFRLRDMGCGGGPADSLRRDGAALLAGRGGAWRGRSRRGPAPVVPPDPAWGCLDGRQTARRAAAARPSGRRRPVRDQRAAPLAAARSLPAAAFHRTRR